MNIARLDSKIIAWLNRWFLPLARVAIFIVYFYFGIIKLLGLSPAEPLAYELVHKTLGLEYFDFWFMLLAVLECVIGVLFLIPKATRIVIPLLLAHMLIVCSPLILLPDHTWRSLLIPTLEGQYIIKNLVIITLALGVAAQEQPFKKGR